MLPPETNTEHGTRKASLNKEQGISVLPTVSKVFERLMDTQISSHMAPYLSWLLCGFRKGYNAQHTLIRAIERWKACLDNGGKITPGNVFAVRWRVPSTVEGAQYSGGLSAFVCIFRY